MSITMKDIADKAGVTRAAVSKILNKKDTMISRATRERVLAIAKELKYRPNFLARSLKNGKTNTIGLLGSMKLIDLGSYNYSRVTQGIEYWFEDTGSAYSLNILGGNFQASYEESFTAIQQGMIDGLIIILLARDIEIFEEHFLPRLREMDLPFVVVHSTTRAMDYNNVGMNLAKTGYEAAAHFAVLGYDDMGVCMWQRNYTHLVEAMEGFKKGVAATGRTWSDDNLIETHVDFETHRPLYERLPIALASVERFPRALYVPQDQAAYAVIKLLREKGLRVPEDVAIIGCDDEIKVPYFDLELTTFHHPFEEKGKEAVAMLIDVLEGRLDRNAVHRRILEPYLVVRRTCGAQL